MVPTVSIPIRRRLARDVPDAAAGAGLSIGQYLIRRLQDYGLKHVFGIPGDYILTFYGQLEKSPIEVVGCTREDCAGFAADAYARINGLGAVCVTYCVGGLSVCNSIAGAYAEKSPVVVISGSPGLGERVNNPLLHHKVRDFRTQIEVFEKLCVAGDRADRPGDRLPRDRPRARRGRARTSGRAISRFRGTRSRSCRRSCTPITTASRRREPQVAEEAVEEAAQLLAKAKRPVIIAGVEIHRFGLQDKVLALAERHADSDRRDDPGQERRPREASAVHRPVRRGDGAGRGDAVRRRERLRAAARARS